MPKNDDAFLYTRGKEGRKELEEIAKWDPYGLREEETGKEDEDGQ